MTRPDIRPTAGGPQDPRPAARSRWRRRVLFFLGWILVAAGVIGLILPGLPGTLFLILAAACFTRSSPRFERWLLEHPRLGPPVHAWRESGAIPRRAKWVACLSMAGSWLMLLATDTPPHVTAAVGLTLAAAAAYVVTRPDGPRA